MDRHLDAESGGTWLAVTSLSFDISVLELFWTLTRGFEVVIHQPLEVRLFARLKRRRAKNDRIDARVIARYAQSADLHPEVLDPAREHDARAALLALDEPRYLHQVTGRSPNGLVRVRDLGELESKPVFRTRVEWYAAMALFHPRCASRLYGITNAAITA